MAAKKLDKVPKPVPAKTAKPKAAKSTEAKPGTRSLRTARVELSLECMRCMHPLRLSRVGEPQSCRSCLHTWSFPASSWASLRAGFAAAIKMGRSGRRFGADFAGSHRVSACVETDATRCPCGAAFDESALLDAIASDQSSVSCACGRPMSVRAPDEALLAMVPGAKAIANEREDPLDGGRPIAFRCACQASLRADGRSRSVECKTCGPVDVPTPLWNVLRPILPGAPLFVVLGKGA